MEQRTGERSEMKLHEKLNECIMVFTIAVLFCTITSCNGGTVLLNVTDISGPGSLNENQVADYSVTVTNSTDIVYNWAVDPPSAGTFTNANLPSTTFHANEVIVNTTVEISVALTGNKVDPTVVSRDVTIVDTNQAPVAMAHSDTDRIGHGQQIQFYDDSTDPEGNDDIIKWEWDFDYNGGAGFDPDSELREPRHQFDDPGDFQVQLRVTDTSGIADMLDVAFNIEVVENIAPVITGIQHNRTTSQTGNIDEAVGLEVIFEDYTPPAGPHDIIWSCDNGYFDDYTSPTPLWFPPDDVGEFDITVEVIDEFGLLDSGSVHQWITGYPTLNNGAAPGNVNISQNLDSAFGGDLNPDDYIHPNDTENGNVIFISFWSSWCGGSLDGIPLLLDIYDIYRNEDDYLHLMTNVGETEQNVVDFVNLNSYEGPYWLLDNTSAYFDQMRGWNPGSIDLPQTMVFDRDGHCRWAYDGQITWTIDMQLAIEELL